jgi:hypothetical protein
MKLLMLVLSNSLVCPEKLAGCSNVDAYKLEISREWTYIINAMGFNRGNVLHFINDLRLMTGSRSIDLLRFLLAGFTFDLLL